MFNSIATGDDPPVWRYDYAENKIDKVFDSFSLWLGDVFIRIYARLKINLIFALHANQTFDINYGAFTPAPAEAPAPLADANFAASAKMSLRRSVIFFKIESVSTSGNIL